MLGYDIYEDIATRTGGDIYMGVVGPVRTGKSTFIKRFMELAILDKISDKNKLKRTIDELPQSADGKTIMTTEPKFVPNEAASVDFDGTKANVRLIDCVGYLIDDALGYTEDGKERMVKTPWSENKMPFQKAAELGTSKVINDHSTVGIVVSCDGTITDIDRSKYVDSEARVISELKAINKPFVVVLNTTQPEDKKTLALAKKMEAKYEVPIIVCDVLNMNKEKLNEIVYSVLYQFPLTSIKVELPKWMRTFDFDNPMIASILKLIHEICFGIEKMCQHKELTEMFAECEYLDDSDVLLEAGKGEIVIKPQAAEGLYFKILSEQCGNDIDDDYKLLSFVSKISRSFNDYEEIRKAMQSVGEQGYGVVAPNVNDMCLEEPEIVKKGSQYGVKLKASAPSYHIVKVDVQTEISPTIGTEQQSEDMVEHLLGEFANNRQGIWDTNMFGRSLHSLVKEDLSTKLNNMPVDAQAKLKKTISRIVNEGKGGVLCILI
ncbi:MAG: stage IV sporulation protein A [Clostridia bacterium]